MYGKVLRRKNSFFLTDLKQSSEHLRDVRENYQNYFIQPSAKCIKLSAFQNITTLVAILKYMKALEDKVAFDTVINNIRYELLLQNKLLYIP